MKRTILTLLALCGVAAAQVYQPQTLSDLGIPWANSNAQASVGPLIPAEFYDNFAMYPTGTRITNGFRPVRGPAYSLSAYYTPTNSTNTSPWVVDGSVRPMGTNETFYLTAVLSNNVRSWGAEVEWAADTNIKYSTAVFIIRTNNEFLGRFLHVVVGETNASIQAATNGAGTLSNLATTNWAEVLPQSTPISIRGSIVSNVLTLNVAGRILTATNPMIESETGRWFTFEQFGYGFNESLTGMARFKRVWANGDLPEQWAMPTTNLQVVTVGGTTNTLVFSNGQLRMVTSP
jgi:hypothetical protein